MKQRFSSLDVKVIAHELNESLVSLRLANIYDLSTKIFLLKFAKPDVKKHLIIDTGFRCHLTEFSRATAGTPSPFVAKLRKFLKTRRLTSVSQVGTDRIIEFTFSDGQYRLFLEFFASGNIILTDANLNILAIARNVSEGDGGEVQRIGLQYALENRQNYHGIPLISTERVKAAITAAIEKQVTNAAQAVKRKSKTDADLRKCLAVSITELPPALIDHALNMHSIDAKTSLESLLSDDSLLDKLVTALADARSIVDNITSTPVCKGYIIGRQQESTGDVSAQPSDIQVAKNILYEDFHPFLPKKVQNDVSLTSIELEGYNQTVDQFFSSLEGQKLESRLQERENTANKKLAAAKQDQTKRIDDLQDIQGRNFRKASAIEANIERVQEAIDSVNGLLAQGMDWIDIGKLVEREKSRQNPVAAMIQLPLKLDQNIISLILNEENSAEEDDDDPFETDESDSDEEENIPRSQTKLDQRESTLTVDIKLSLSPWGNAREYYEQKRSAAFKEEKTQVQASKALKSAEQKIEADLKKALKHEKALLQPIRQAMWFEKFFWFISSDGYLVLAGKDPAQDEILYKRYLRRGDIFCHSEVQGAAIVVVRNGNERSDAPIPPATLSQAGSFSICTSQAWDSKAGVGAWWVDAHQVSKLDTTGNVLPAGKFHVTGHKSHLPPGQLLLGVGLMFKITKESKQHHLKHRVVDEAHHNLGDDIKLTEGIQQKRGSGNDDGNSSEDDDFASTQGSDDDHQANPLQGFVSTNESESEQIAELSLMHINQESPSAEISEKINQNDSDIEEEEPVPEQEDQSANDTSNLEDVELRAASQPTDSKPGHVKRGQRGKAKKIAAKYKDQDDEDRAIAETLIGATAGVRKAESEAKEQAERAAALEAAKARRRAQHVKTQKEVLESEEKRRQMMDEGNDIDGFEDVDEELAVSLDTLVGTPLPGDEIIEVVTICAPIAALGKVKYKVKVQPGTMKKGKAVKDILERWKIDAARRGSVDNDSRDVEKMWPREVELLGTLKAEEMVNAVPPKKVRLMVVGGGGNSKGNGASGKGSAGRNKGKR